MKLNIEGLTQEHQDTTDPLVSPPVLESKPRKEPLSEKAIASIMGPSDEELSDEEPDSTA